MQSVEIILEMRLIQTLLSTLSIFKNKPQTSILHLFPFPFTIQFSSSQLGSMFFLTLLDATDWKPNVTIQNLKKKKCIVKKTHVIFDRIGKIKFSKMYHYKNKVNKKIIEESINDSYTLI